MKIKKSLENNISKQYSPFPKVFVTDQSLALINSMMEIFNNCTMNQYLEWCFDILILKIRKIFINTSIPIYGYLCASHYLKNIIQHTNDALNLKKKYKKIDDQTLLRMKIKELFIYSFTLLQNSVNIEDFNNDLSDIYFIFKSKTKNKHFHQSFERITKRLYLRDNSVMFDLSKDDEEIQKNIDEFKLISRDVKIGVKENSPFNKYFEKFLDGIENTIESNYDLISEKNEFYFPNLP